MFGLGRDSVGKHRHCSCNQPARISARLSVCLSVLILVPGMRLLIPQSRIRHIAEMFASQQ